MAKSKMKNITSKGWFLPALGVIAFVVGAVIGVLNDGFRTEVLALETKIKNKG